MSADITIAIQCHNFSRRLCWLLSSVLQRQRTDASLDRLLIDIAYIPGAGSPPCGDVIKLFESAGLEMKHTPYPSVDVFQYRGRVRNRQLDECPTRWIMFADADVLYPPEFFDVLGWLLTGLMADSKLCMYGPRFSTRRVGVVDRLVARYQYPAVVPDAFRSAVTALPLKLMPNVGAGYCQIVDAEHIRATRGSYLDLRREIDGSWETGVQRARSDKYFRETVGSRAIPLPAQLHLNHMRDTDFKKHIEVPR